MNKKELIKELERRLRLLNEYHEGWAAAMNRTTGNDYTTAVAMSEYYKGKAQATLEAIKLITGER